MIARRKSFYGMNAIENALTFITELGRGNVFAVNESEYSYVNVWYWSQS